MRFKIPKTKKTEPLYYKVYYEKATGQIISISIKDKPSLDTHFTTTFNEVCEFIDGTKSLINYLCSQQCFDANITELILTEYLDILDKRHKLQNGDIGMEDVKVKPKLI